MRYSQQREEILKIVQSTIMHPTADWVYDKVRKVIPNISLGTVYRNLNQLVSMDKINQVYDGPVVRYDGYLKPHDHFRCEQCGRIYDIEKNGTSVIDNINDQVKHTIKGYSMQLEGVCETCENELK